MLYNSIKHILPRFCFEGEYVDVNEQTSGNVNNTYCLTYDQNGKTVYYTLQHINSYVFKDPHAVMRNIERVTEHIRSTLVSNGIDPHRRVLELVPTRDGQTLYVDPKGGFWRAYIFISEATPYNMPQKPVHVFETGRAFGEFQKLLSNFPAEDLNETIPNFHNTTRRFYTFVASVAEDRAGRARQVDDEIEFMFDHRRLMNSIVSRLESGELQPRVTHNDTKINNVLIDDATDKAICVIDLDTVMPGSSLYDYGDAIRFCANTAAEDEPDVSRISLDMEKVRLFTEGFLSEVKGFLPDSEVRLLPLGALVITCELAMRFLTDYIDGDLYFKVSYPEHNLVRARAQIALLKDMETKYDEMCRVVETFLQ